MEDAQEQEILERIDRLIQKSKEIDEKLELLRIELQLNKIKKGS
jgi:hypothetical protein